NALCDRCTEDCEAIFCDYHFFKNLPTVDAEPVKHGHWAEEPLACNGDSIIRCSACNRAMIIGKQIGMVDNYCPNCGAKMDEVVSE
ncbi:MAG: hypothetical protein KBT27_05455, partial [Prevotellaceae bacterium]|nr:hypothetical protein [Candidatus Faecinaster equi]